MLLLFTSCNFFIIISSKNNYKNDIMENYLKKN